MEKREKTINDRHYQLLLPPVRPAMALCTQVAALLGPALGSLGSQADGEGWGRFSSAIRAVDPSKVDALFMEAVRISLLCHDGKRIVEEKEFNQHFDTFRSDVYPVCLWALWECVRDFFPDSIAFSQLLKRAMVEGFAEGLQFPSPKDGR